MFVLRRFSAAQEWVGAQWQATLPLPGVWAQPPLNATLRARIGRLVRKSLSFSRSLKLLDACINLFLHAYNRTRQSI